jgi:cytochrome c-type biogenesis protein
MQIGGVNILVAFLAGLVSCVSPCVLPLAPIYIGNLAGGTVRQGHIGVADRRAPILHGLAFLAGFILLFLALGVSAGFAGYLLRGQLALLQKLGGVLVILLGLQMSGLVRLPLLFRGLGFDWDSGVANGYLRSFVAGGSISAGWLPCIGPTLGAILTLAATSGTAAQGGVLLLVYAVGLAVPFAAIGVTLSRTPSALRWMNRHHDAIAFVAGVVLIATGVLLFTGSLQRLNALFNLSGSGIGTSI